MSSAIWVYVNNPNDKALLHIADCVFCNEGRGMAEDKQKWNGEWLGPFEQAAAERAALRAKKKTTRWCGHCARRLGLKDTNLGGGY